MSEKKRRELPYIITTPGIQKCKEKDAKLPERCANVLGLVDQQTADRVPNKLFNKEVHFSIDTINRDDLLDYEEGFGLYAYVNGKKTKLNFPEEYEKNLIYYLNNKSEIEKKQLKIDKGIVGNVLGPGQSNTSELRGYFDCQSFIRSLLGVPLTPNLNAWYNEKVSSKGELNTDNFKEGDVVFLSFDDITDDGGLKNGFFHYVMYIGEGLFIGKLEVGEIVITDAENLLKLYPYEHIYKMNYLKAYK